jgi:hypothetical protein
VETDAALLESTRLLGIAPKFLALCLETLDTKYNCKKKIKVEGGGKKFVEN